MHGSVVSLISRNSITLCTESYRTLVSPDLLSPRSHASPPTPPPPLPSPARLVRPDDLPSHEQVAKWVAFERQSKRERKKERWQQQMFAPYRK